MNRVIRLIQHLLCQRRTSVEDFFDQPVIDQIHRLTGHLGFEFIPPRRVFCGGLFGHLLQPRTNAFDRILGGAKLQCRLCKAIDQPLIGALGLCPAHDFRRATPEPFARGVLFQGFLPCMQPRLGRGFGQFGDNGAQRGRQTLGNRIDGEVLLRIVGDTLTYLEL